MPPLVKFYQFIESARAPARADRSANGTLPTRAFQYCEAVTAATAFGWHVFPPLPFSLLFDGAEVAWSCPAFEGFIPLSRAAQYPFLSQKFDEIAPNWAKGFCPPLLSALKEPGLVQIWSGLIAETKPGYSLLVRPPPNLPRSRGYDQYEGIVESDVWFGPLFTNVRLLRTDFEVTFSPTDPLFMLQPLRREEVSDQSLSNFTVKLVKEFSDENWIAYKRTVIQRNENGCPIGEDAKARRKRSASSERRL